MFNISLLGALATATSEAPAPITVNGFYTLILAALVLLMGRFLVRKVRVLRKFNIPEPVAGGLVVAIFITILYYATGYQFVFFKPLQVAFMLIFFASIGLSADFARLKAGGKPLIVFLGVVSLFIVIQDGVGAALAKALGLDPLIGLITGSITLTGGHGTAAAWGSVLTEKYHISGASGLGIASATFGLVIGGLIGGPVAFRLIKKMGLKELPEASSDSSPESDITNHDEDLQFEHPEHKRLITSNSTIETLALFAACLAFSEIMVHVAKGTWFQLPQFVWALAGGVIIRNVATKCFKVNMFDRAIDVFGNASLGLFLAMALLSLKLWTLAGLAGPVIVILLVQTLVMALYATYITYNIMGRDYDASVLAAGHCGFGMGATPTAIANMQAITEHYGPSHKSFLIVPMVGAFFIDIVNAFILQGFVSFLH